MSGAFFRPLAIGYVMAILASLFVALIVTPAMCLLILPGEKASVKEPPLSRWLRRPYRAMLPWFINRPKSAITFLTVALGLTLVLVNNLGQEFLPNFQETDFLMHFVEKPGTSIEAMDRVTIQASRELRAIPGVLNFGSHYRHLQQVEGEPFGLNLVVRGAEERLIPILMTVLTTALALLPLAISGNKPGHEIEYPLAVVIVGGLVTSTFLNLFLLPPLYLLWGRNAVPLLEDSETV